MELKVGMYVRFKDKRGNQYIRRIIDIPKDNRYASIYLDKEANYVTGISLKNIIKASYDIIDLIEVGDYVNGVEVEDINNKEIMLVDTHLWIDKEVANRLIESIVTHEQMEAMQYVIK